jgi:choline-sulfatase
VSGGRGLLVALALASAASGCRDRKPAPTVAHGADAATPPRGGGVDAGGHITGDGGAPPPGHGAAAPGADASAAAAPVRVEHVVWRALDNRAMAHRTIGDDVVLDAGGSGFARFLHFGVPEARWSLAHWVDGEAAATAASLSAIEVPLSAEQARATAAVVLRLHASAAAKVTFKLNGRKPRKKPIELAVGWQTIAQAVPPGWMRPGANQWVMEVGRRGHDKASVSVAWVRVGASADFSSPLPAARFVAEPANPHIELRVGSSLAWYLTVPEGGHLLAAVAAPCQLEVRAQSSDGGFVGGRLAGASGRVDLSSFAGRVVRLGVRAIGDDLSAPRCEVAAIRELVITTHEPPPLPPGAGKPPRYVILWMLDATRADSIPAFTPGASTQTPALDELARTSTVFRQYYVQGNESQTSHASVWTGVYPAVHNVRMAGEGGTYRLSKRLPLIAELVRGGGLVPIAVTGNGFISEGGGYDRGFEEFRNMMREPTVKSGVLFGDKIVSAALGRFEAHRAEPTFLFLGTVDSHAPWIARKPWIDRYSPGPYDGPFKDFGDAVALGFRAGSMGCANIPAPKDIDRLRAIYQSTISYSDDLIGKLIAQLKIWNVWDETMLIITADHGDELFEHRRCGHGGSLRETLVRVPLLIHYPAQFPAAVVDEGAEGVDLVPTILEALAAPPLASAQGASLRPLAAGANRGWAWPSYASQYEYAHAMRLGRWKIVVNVRGEAEIFDVVADPYENEDRSLTHTVERQMLADHLGLFLATRARWQKARWGVVSNLTSEGAEALDAPTQ